MTLNYVVSNMTLLFRHQNGYSACKTCSINPEGFFVGFGITFSNC